MAAFSLKKNDGGFKLFGELERRVKRKDENMKPFGIWRSGF